MRYNKYKIEDIEIDGEVYFDDVYSGKLLTQSNYDAVLDSAWQRWK